MTEDTDRALMARIGKGDEKALELLIRRHERMVYNVALRFLNDDAQAEDICQETFYRVYRAAASYTPDAKYTTWLYTIVRNLCFNALRKRNSADLVSIEDENMPEIPSGSISVLQALEVEELRKRVSAAVQELPQQMRMAVLLHKFQGLQHDEIAEICGCSVNAVKLRVHRAKAILAAKLGDLRRET